MVCFGIKRKKKRRKKEEEEELRQKVTATLLVHFLFAFLKICMLQFSISK